MSGQGQAVDWTKVHPALEGTPGEPKKGVTVLLYGGPGTRKTTWAGTWPNPVFCSIGLEGGDDALDQIPRIYQGVQRPPNFTISTVAEMVQRLNWIITEGIAKGFRTIVIDSVTSYVMMWTSELISAKKKALAKGEKVAGGAIMTQPDWGLLETHLIKELAPPLHASGMNVIWIALENPKEAKVEGGIPTPAQIVPAIPGASARSLPALCKMIIHAEQRTDFDPGTGRRRANPVFWTAPGPLTPHLRHKYFDAFPYGRLVCPYLGDQPTFWAVQSQIGQYIY